MRPFVSVLPDSERRCSRVAGQRFEWRHGLVAAIRQAVTLPRRASQPGPRHPAAWVEARDRPVRAQCDDGARVEEIARAECSVAAARPKRAAPRIAAVAMHGFQMDAAACWRRRLRRRSAAGPDPGASRYARLGAAMPGVAPAARYASSAARTARSPTAWVTHWKPARANLATSSVYRSGSGQNGMETAPLRVGLERATRCLSRRLRR